MDLASAVYHWSHPPGRSSHWKARGDKFVASDEPVYRNCVHETVFPLIDERSLNYARASQLQYSVLFAEFCIKYIVDDVMTSRYLAKQSRTSYTPFVRLGGLMRKNPKTLSLMESPNNNYVNANEVEISYLNSKVSRSHRASYVFLLIEATEYYISTV